MQPHSSHDSVFFFQAEDGIRDVAVTGVQTCALPIFREQLEGRSMLVKKAKVFPIECVVRGFLTGSGLKDYNRTGQVCGIALPAGLRDSDRLPRPIFTPRSEEHTSELQSRLHLVCRL